VSECVVFATDFGVFGLCVFVVCLEFCFFVIWLIVFFLCV